MYLKERHPRGIAAPIVLRRMGHVSDRDAAHDALVVARIVAREHLKPKGKPAPHVAHIPVRERYLAWIAGGIDHRHDPFSPFGPES